MAYKENLNAAIEKMIHNKKRRQYFFFYFSSDEYNNAIRE